jgi:hypothetical protein
MIAISYRREDSTPIAGRLFDRLVTEFGKGNVFMDFDSIPYGMDFRKQIQQSLSKADALVVIVGPQWSESATGIRRLDNSDDFVRFEIRCALESGIPIIPVLVNNATMPKAESLPADIGEFAFRNALVLDTGVDFHHHASRLISGVRDLVQSQSDATGALLTPPAISGRDPVKPNGKAVPPPGGDRNQPPANQRRRRTLIVIGMFMVLLIGTGGFVGWSMIRKQQEQREQQLREQNMIVVEGIVIDEMRETPIEKASVKLHFANGETVSADASTGHFRFPAVDRTRLAGDGNYLEATFEAMTRRLPINGSIDSLKAVRIPLLITGVAVSGRVVDSNDRSINGAKISLVNPAGETIDTIFAQNGGFTFPNVKVPRVVVRAERGEIKSEKEIDVKRDWRDAVVLKLNLVLPPPFKRTFFTLKGHAVDTFANEKKLPKELEPTLAGSVPLINTQALAELNSLLAKFGRPLGVQPSRLGPERSADDETPEATRREAAVKKIEKTQLKTLSKEPVLLAAGGMENIDGISIDAAKLPSSFLTEALWSIRAEQLDDFLTENKISTGHTGARLEIPIDQQNLVLSKSATRTDLDALRRMRGTRSEGPSDALLRFFDHICRNGTPTNFLTLSVTGIGCAIGPILTVESPVLLVRVVALENTTDRTVEVGNFHFRMVDPGGGKPLVRTRKENNALLGAVQAESQPWYKPRMLKPGETLVVPLELIFRPKPSEFSDFSEEGASSETAPASKKQSAAKKLTADRQLQTIALVYSKDAEGGTGARATLASMNKQKFVDALLREPVRPAKTDEFVYGPSITLDAIEVDGFRYEIEPFDPVYIAYFSEHAEGGSCPFVYSRAQGGDWVKRGTILTGLSSRKREGTRTLNIAKFDGTLRIAEEEDETSYIDELFVRGTLANGERVTVHSDNDSITRKDHRYLVLKKGESIEIKFPVRDWKPATKVEVIASGFFELARKPETR